MRVPRARTMTSYESLAGSGSGLSGGGGGVSGCACHWLKHMKLYRVGIIIAACLLLVPFVFYYLLLNVSRFWTFFVESLFEIVLFFFVG